MRAGQVSLATPIPELAVSPNFSSRGEAAAHAFEAQLLGCLLEDLEKALSGLPGEEPMAGGDDYNYMATRALAGALAAHGGFGIARLISQHLPVHESK